ncbi:uncharacterized protein LOC127801401 isoform X2 [Diospyros lotus]|uniref:uncharacterized protein LOC127801401 isoform X2 n=1 Tax=Diospyros lotus TaxID=55363 RepID=UPI002258FE17|nr:uncharacterized protein LOC127801401 isoform X2 [Diospyros lotus]
MQSPCIVACKTFTSSCHLHHLRGFRNQSSLSSPSSSSSLAFVSICKFYPSVSCGFDGGSRERVTARGKDNVWSADNDMAKAAKERAAAARRRKRGKSLRKWSKSDKVMLSGAMLVEVETVLQTQEPVIRPAWNTFASSVSGIWKGVGAVFSPITAEMEPIDMGNKNENLYDCYTLLRIEAVPPPSGGKTSQIRRTINWVTMNPYGEIQMADGGSNNIKKKSKNGDASLLLKETDSGRLKRHTLPKFESFDFKTTDVMEEDQMGVEPGLVFFECLVKGCHKRLRIVHTIEFSNGGSNIQIMRVAVYEEQWVSPANIHDESDLEFDLKPFSQRKRTQPSELTGSWKVFEVSATPIYGEEALIEESNGAPYVYLCTETLKKRSLPGNTVCFGEEEMLDMQDITMLWLPGGVTGYVDVSKEGVLCIGVGWYSDEGINLVMEREYGVDGNLREVRSKSEVKRRWPEPLPA